MKYSAVLFDFDGVIAKTMQDNLRAWKYALGEYGMPIRDYDYYPLEGMPVVAVAESILKKFHKDLSLAAEIAALKDTYYASHNSFAVYPGVKPLLKALRKSKFSLALVSGASRKRLLSTADKDLIALFDVVVTGDDVRRGKPDPEPYIIAARLLEKSRASCLAIENAPLGIESAKKAGMYCIAVESTLKKQFLKGADKIIQKVSDLNKLLL